VDAFLTGSIIFASAAWTLFTVSYSIRAKWWKTAFGLNMMGVSFVFAVLLARLALLYLFPDAKADLKIFGSAIYVAAGILGVHRFILMEKSQRAKGKHTSLL